MSGCILLVEVVDAVPSENNKMFSLVSFPVSN
jgi:hypothetical protein